MPVGAPADQSSGNARQAAPPDPRFLDLASAVGEIRQACDELGKDARLSPFFFVVGAGISYPPVPLAAAVIEECQSVAKRYGRAGAQEGGAALDVYSLWFGRAYPGARQRQAYLRKLIDKKPLSLASLRLAHLLSAHKLTNVVVTTNFDDFIARALRLFGEEPAVCDHPRTVGRIDLERHDVQIVHVHGSYLFYDLANLRGEVTERARPDEDMSLTMVGLLDNLLWNRSPLVIGYSGWDGDIVMSALRRRLRGGSPLAQSIYWFAYKRGDVERLPSWLRDSADVRFVVPDEAPAETKASVQALRGTGASGGEPRTEPTLPAFTVFDRMNQVFEIGPPALFENPVKYFARSLEASLPDAELVGGDPYAFKALVQRLYRAGEEWGKEPRSQARDVPLEKLRESMRESKYKAAAALLATIIPARLSKLDPVARQEVFAAAALAGAALSGLTDAESTPRGATAPLTFDIRFERTLGQLPPGVAWCVASRPGQYGQEMQLDGKFHGAMTWHFVRALRDRKADLDGDGRVSVLEATILSAKALAKQAIAQTPVVAGDADRIALFGTGQAASGSGASGTIHALLVGVGNYGTSIPSLHGPANDVALMARLLGTRARRLYSGAKVTRLLDKDVTRRALQKAISALAAATRERDLALVYFSGHAYREETTPKGEPRTEYILVLRDYDRKGRGQLRQSELMALIAPAKAAQKLIVLDF